MELIRGKIILRAGPIFGYCNIHVYLLNAHHIAVLNLFLDMFYSKSGGWLFESFGQFMTSHKGGLASMSQERLFKFIADKNICSLKRFLTNVPEEL